MFRGLCYLQNVHWNDVQATTIVNYPMLIPFLKKSKKYFCRANDNIFTEA